MKTFKEYILESSLGSLSIFDVDETLFQTTAKIAVKKDGKIVKSLSNQEFNTYKLEPGEEFDFSEFRDADKFYRESKPIQRMMGTARSVLKHSERNPNSRVIIVTARSDFDDKNKFLSTFIKHQFNINKVYVERAGNLNTGSSASNKVVVIRKHLSSGRYNTVRLFDDAISNINAFLGLRKEFPLIRFEGYLVDHNGNVKSIR
jgi:hypothetical protein